MLRAWTSIFKAVWVFGYRIMESIQIGGNWRICNGRHYRSSISTSLDADFFSDFFVRSVRVHLRDAGMVCIVSRSLILKKCLLWSVLKKLLEKEFRLFIVFIFFISESAFFTFCYCYSSNFLSILDWSFQFRLRIRRNWKIGLVWISCGLKLMEKELRLSFSFLFSRS